MKNRSKLRERFLRDHVSVQLGNLASNLARIANFITLEMEQAAITELLDESKFMIEWAGPSATLEQQFILVELQRCLVRWRFTWADISSDATQRLLVINKAREWSAQLVAISGLLDEEPAPVTKQPENSVSLVTAFS